MNVEGEPESTSFGSIPDLPRLDFQDAQMGRSCPFSWSAFATMLNRQLAAWSHRQNGVHISLFAASPAVSLFHYIRSDVHFAYLCWGLPKRASSWRALRLWKLITILRAARCIFVQDDVTRRWIRRYVGRAAIIVPLPVDTEFFVPRPEGTSRRGYLLIPGNNDRREDFVLRLAERGNRVVRVTSEPLVLRRYDGELRRPNLTLEYRVRWERLRELYQYADAVILPTGGTTHCGGQTSMLEALACGTTVFTNSSHLLSIARLWNLSVRRLASNPDSLVEQVRAATGAEGSREAIGLPKEFSVRIAWEIYLASLLASGWDGRQTGESRTVRPRMAENELAGR